MIDPIEDNLRIFFRDPNEIPEAFGTHGVLYLLRRDVVRCVQNDNVILFPALMMMLAGIDLLGKFYAGSDAGSFVGDRFRNFIIEYFTSVSDEDAETLYQLRNALLHSFGLFSRGRGGKEYHFAIGPATRFVNAFEGRYYINPKDLYAQFESAIQQYQEDLSSDAALRAKFQAMFDRYGTTILGVEK